MVGLPRSGTTSFCVAALDLGYRTAHTAYTANSLIEAEVIADTPVFCDYPELFSCFPDSEIILLTRQPCDWLPSIKQLLQRMSKNLFSSTGGFNDTIKRSYLSVFNELNDANLADDEFLLSRYEQHANAVRHFCLKNFVVLHEIEIESLCYETLSNVLPVRTENNNLSFPHLNKNGKVTAWNDVKHPLKIESTKLGKVDPDHRLYQNLKRELCLN